MCHSTASFIGHRKLLKSISQVDRSTNADVKHGTRPNRTSLSSIDSWGNYLID